MLAQDKGDGQWQCTGRLFFWALFEVVLIPIGRGAGREAGIPDETCLSNRVFFCETEKQSQGFCRMFVGILAALAEFVKKMFCLSLQMRKVATVIKHKVTGLGFFRFGPLPAVNSSCLFKAPATVFEKTGKTFGLGAKDTDRKYVGIAPAAFKKEWNFGKSHLISGMAGKKMQQSFMNACMQHCFKIPFDQGIGLEEGKKGVAQNLSVARNDVSAAMALEFGVLIAYMFYIFLMTRTSNIAGVWTAEWFYNIVMGLIAFFYIWKADWRKKRI